MPKPLHFHLSRRESEIMDVVYRLGEATAAEVQGHLRDDVSYNSVRVTLGILENKGYLVHRRDGARHVFRPTLPTEKARKPVLRHILKTFFGGSAPRAVSMLLDMSAGELSDEELAELGRMVDKAREERREE